MEIVKKQHIFPARSISRFYNSTGSVEVNLIAHSKVLRTTNRDQLFTERQIWDQHSEQGYGREIERSYQKLTDFVVETKEANLPPEANQVLTSFYMLWYSRSVITEKDSLLAKDIKITDLPGVGLNDLERNRIELNHGMYVNEDQTLPIRFQRGMVIKGAIERFYDRNPNLKWHICKSRKLEFIVSDSPRQDLIIPISPHLCYSCHINYGCMSDGLMRFINLNAIFRSRNYYFSRSLSKCIF